MSKHLRANLLLLVASVLLCSVLYPGALLLIGQTLFHDKAEGSLIYRDGKLIGSRLIAQDFKGDEYFQPRPSAASYNASASSGSNLGANNPKLRDRVARQLGTEAKYRDGGGFVGPDVEKWFADNPGLLAVWARRYP